MWWRRRITCFAGTSPKSEPLFEIYTGRVGSTVLYPTARLLIGRRGRTQIAAGSRTVLGIAGISVTLGSFSLVYSFGRTFSSCESNCWPSAPAVILIFRTLEFFNAIGVNYL